MNNRKLRYQNLCVTLGKVSRSKNWTTEQFQEIILNDELKNKEFNKIIKEFMETEMDKKELEEKFRNLFD